MDQFGLLPPEIRANIEREELIDRQMRAAVSLQRALKDMDPSLSVVFIPAERPKVYGITPGRWHVRRQNETTADSYMAITTPDGGYREPDHGVLRELMDRDLRREFKIPTPPKPKDRDEQRVDEIADDLKAAWRLPGDGGLTGRWWGKGKKS